MEQAIPSSPCFLPSAVWWAIPSVGAHPLTSQILTGYFVADAQLGVYQYSLGRHFSVFPKSHMGPLIAVRLPHQANPDSSS